MGSRALGYRMERILADLADGRARTVNELSAQYRVGKHGLRYSLDKLVDRGLVTGRRREQRSGYEREYTLRMGHK